MLPVRVRLLLLCCDLLLFSVGALPVAAQTPTQPAEAPVFIEEFIVAPDLRVRQIREDVYVITHAFPWPANALLVVMGSGDLVLVDTPYTPEATTHLLAWLAETFDDPVADPDRQVVAINTGFHVDNLGGNSALLEAGIPVYGSDRTVRLLEERGELTRAYMLEWLRGQPEYYEAHAAIPFVPPTHVFPLEEGLELPFGDELVQVYFPGPSHTLDNVVVYFPAQRVLFGGCMILAGDRVGNAEDADLAAWPEAVRRLEAFAFDILVPGHGDRYDPGLLAHTIRVLEASAPRRR